MLWQCHSNKRKPLTMDDRKQRVEEFETLEAIFGDVMDIRCDYNTSNSCDVTIRGNDSRTELRLQFATPEDYPSCSPPTYQIGCPFLSASQKELLSARFQQLYVEHLGQYYTFLRYINKSRKSRRGRKRQVYGISINVNTVSNSSH